MKIKAGKKAEPQLYTHIASAIIPSASIVAVPSAAKNFPQQKTRGTEQWGSFVPALLHASTTNQLLVLPSSSLTNIDTRQQHDGQTRSVQKTNMGRIDPSSDEEDSDEDERQRQPIGKHTTSQSSALPTPEKRLTHRVVHDEESRAIGTEHDSTIHLDPKQALTAELSRSIDEKSARRAAVASPRQSVPPLNLNPVQSQAGPTSARNDAKLEGFGIEPRTTGTVRSSLNDTTTVPASARSVSLKEPVVHEDYELSTSSKSEDSTTVLDVKKNSILNQLVPPPEDYQQNLNGLERRNQSLNSEVQQLRLNNRTLQRQYEELLEQLQTSHKLSQQELTDILKQTGRDQTKGLEELNTTLQNRCDQLQNELSVMKDRYTQSQNQSSLRELKEENHFLKDYIHRLNAASSDYQATHPPKSSKKEMEKEQRRLQGLPLRGPSPIWLLNQKFLAPLFVCYDEKLFEKDEFIKKLRSELNAIHEQVKLLINENASLHERLARTATTSGNHDHQLSDIEHIKRQAYLVLEENKVLQEQLDLQTNRLTDVQKTQIQEVSNLTRRLLIVESEKSESDRVLDTIRLRNDDLKRKYDQLMLDNSHRIHVQEHMQEISEMKRLTDELSEKHAHEMQLLLRRVQDAEAAKRISHLKLTDQRSDVERLKGEIKVLKKTVKKLQLRVQTYEKKLELEQVKEQRITTILDKTNEDLEQTKIERDTYLELAKVKEDELNKTQLRLNDEGDKLTQLEERLENYKSRTKERSSEAQEQLKQQHDNLKLRCLEHEQRIQQLISLLNEKQALVDDLYNEKRNLEVDLETIWQATNADGMRIREQLVDMRVTS
ncbi:unnamed protein product [Adineta ricciae]|uniref:Centrosomal protein of 89 kDa n=1 Tax=Adineta ricciae TaxID=249248 RepID=A0A814VB51_ADIRI|nr:unnamed protein product [Adineta ricciae]CAF1183029.1 unnamed protein product [Adineta ricciae]